LLNIFKNLIEGKAFPLFQLTSCYFPATLSSRDTPQRPIKKLR